MARSLKNLPVNVQRYIDARCDEFEWAWKEGDAPSLEEFLQDCDEQATTYLLRELLAIELQYRRSDNGQPLADHEILELHPEHRTALAAELDRMRATLDVPTPAREIADTPLDALETTAGSGHHHIDSAGLQIRCPHCNNAVEMLAETAIDDVTCRSCGSIFNLVDDDPAAAESLGVRTLGRFKLISQLGVGGFGSVWKARDAELDRFVAVKIPRKRRLGRTEMELFFREARTAAQLRHPNIVPIHEIGRELETGTIYIVSDLIRGVSLMDWMKENRLSHQEMASLGAIISDALHYAHQQGIIHRDLKPSNVMIDQLGQPHVMDFGLAKREVGEITMTMDGHLLGTPAYMSPEQARGEAHWTDRRTDVYSLGVMLYELATGELPFRGNAQMQVQQRLTNDAPDPRLLNRHIPRDLATICLKCLERDPNRRYGAAGEVAEELRRFVRGEPVLARPISRTERAIRWTRRKPLAAALLALVTFLAVAGPTTAIVLEGQRRMLATRDRERAELMDRYTRENRALSINNARLQQEKDALTGGYPGIVQFVPSWRRNLIEEFIDKHHDALVAKLAADQSETAAQAHVGLASMLRELGRLETAADHLKQAAEIYGILAAKSPEEPRFAIAQARCYAQRGELAEARGEVELAQKWTGQALDLRQALAKAHPAHVAPQIDLLSSHMVTMSLAADDPKSQQRLLLETQPLKQRVSDNWPGDPENMYDLARALTGRDPLATE